jgi:hypothetical protein
MILRITALTFTLAMIIQGDTLRLRSGGTVTGSFLGGTANEVRFMVDDQVRRFPLADVVAVDFSGAMTSSEERVAPIVDPPPPVRADPQPNVVGVPFMRGAAGLISLESEMPMLVRNNTMYGMGGGTVYRIQGPQSPVRVRQGDRLVFVVRLTSGDPRQFQLYRLESRMNYRQTQATMGGSPMGMQVSINRVSDSVYEIAPTRNLPPGEYAISPMNSSVTYCFGIDY